MERFGKKHLKIVIIFLGPALIILFCTTIFPTIYSFILSFRQYNLAKPFIPRTFVGVKNYIDLLTSIRFYNSLYITFKLMAIVISIELVLGFALALILTQNLRGMRVLRTFFMIPMMISPVVVALIWLFFYYPGLGYLNYFLDFLKFLR